MPLARMGVALLLSTLGVAASVLAPPSVYAWELTKSTNGVVISKESTDSTATINVNLYYDYKGGTSWVYSSANDRRPHSTLAYSKSTSLVTLQGSTYESIEVPLQPGYRCQLVRFSLAASPFTEIATYAVLNEPMQVSVVGTPTVTGSMKVSGSVNATITSAPVEPVGSVVVTGTPDVRVAASESDSIVVALGSIGAFGAMFIVGYKAVGA